jgi:CrcB protein
LTNLLWIGVGGFVGAILRYLVGAYVQGLTQSLNFPYGTLVVNLVGCWLIGFLFYLPALHDTLDNQLRLLLITGVLGAFTTFSTFGNESLRLLQNQRTGAALIYIGASVCAGLVAVRVGQLLAEQLR